MKKTNKFFNSVFLILFICITLFPVVFLVVGSTNNNSWVFSNHLNLNIGTYFLKNLINLSHRYLLTRIFLNSLISSLTVMLVSIVLIVLFIYSTIYVLKYNFKFLESIFLILMFIPSSSYFLGSVFTINVLNMDDNFLGLIVPYLINLRMYFYLKLEIKAIPREFVDNLIMDGATPLQIIKETTIGLLNEKLIFSMLLIFISSWNNFLIPLNTISEESFFTIPLLVSSISDPMDYFYGETFIALFLQTVPIIFVYLSFVKTHETSFEIQGYFNEQ